MSWKIEYKNRSLICSDTEIVNHCLQRINETDLRNELTALMHLMSILDKRPEQLRALTIDQIAATGFQLGYILGQDSQKLGITYVADQDDTTSDSTQGRSEGSVFDSEKTVPKNNQ